MIKRSPHFSLCAVLSVLLICLILVPCVSAATKPTIKATPKATVPPVLLACSHAKYPEAAFTCSFPENQSADIPDGPPYAVRCTDNSSSESDQPLTTWRWEFGDGMTSAEQNPKHSYSVAGQYMIRLTVTTWCGSEYSNTTVSSLDIYCSVPEPEFTTNVTEGFAPLAVQVTDRSQKTRENLTTWTYWFDNNPYSNDKNPVFFYSTPGTYTIRQTVWKDCVRAGSEPYPAFIREIKVNPTASLSPDINGSNTTPATMPAPTSMIAGTSALPVDTTSSIDSVQNIPGVPGSGTLSVKTEPSGAQIYVDNVLRGTSPLMVGLLEGSHTILLEKESFRNVTVPVQINSGKVTEYSATLVSAESNGIALIPVITLAVIILVVAGVGIYLYRKQKSAPP